jgi:hypothetical protein
MNGGFMFGALTLGKSELIGMERVGFIYKDGGEDIGA